MPILHYFYDGWFDNWTYDAEYYIGNCDETGCDGQTWAEMAN